MSLVNRVSTFFLAALAVALLGYSATLYILARNHLYGEFDSGLRNALRILSASVEVEADDAKWQPGEFAVDLAGLQDVVWIVSNEQGEMIDHSPGFSRDDPDDQLVLEYSTQGHTNSGPPQSIGSWRVLQKQLVAPTPKPVELRAPHEYAAVRITVARSPARVHAQMREIMLVLGLLPAIVLLVAAIGGRWYTRKALQPLRSMATRAHSMKVADFGLRLPVAHSGDELADLGNAFNALLDQLQQAYDRERRFTGSAAHQLRTPLTVLQGQIDVALRRPRESEEYRQTLQVLSDQVAEFSQIVESLLFLARSEEDATPPDLAPLAFDAWLEDSMTLWEHHPRRSDVSIHTGADAAVMATIPLLNQLLANLVSNALKYSEAGTPVVLQTHLEHGSIVLTVEDQGMGIASDDLARVFEPFYRASAARQAGVAGVGLGLAISARIASALGGSLECNSTPGQGSTFGLILPSVAVANGVTSSQPADMSG